MAKQRRLRLQKYGISDARYDELKAVCRQYNEFCGKLRTYSECQTLTEAQKKEAAECLRKKNAVEAAAKISTSDECGIYEPLIKNVTCGVPFYELTVPLSEKAFYDFRVAFFINLDREL